MALKADAQGFLIGDPVDIGKAVDQLRGIRNDVAEIRKAFKAMPANDGALNSSSSTQSLPRVTQDSSNNSGASSSVNKPKLRSSGPELPPLGSGGVLTPASRAENGTMLTKAPSNVFTPTRRKRDASGRFVSVDNSPKDDESKEKKKEKSQQSLLGGFANRIATAVKESAAGTEDVDPTIKAFQEVATPMMRGYDILLGGGDKKEGWYKKIFKSLESFRKDESVFNKTQAKILKNIEAKPVGGSGDAGGGGVMAMLAGLLGGKGVGGLMGGLGKGLLGGGKGLLKRIPLLGALIGGLGAASDVFGTESDGSLTRAEKDRRDGKSVGGFAGSLGGMWAGAAAGSFLGPIGTVVGGAVGMFLGDQGGQIIGEKVGEWTTQLREADIPGKIIGAWETTTSAIKSGWDGALKLMSDAWGKTKELGNAANDFVKDKTGVDVKQGVKDAHADAVKYVAEKTIPAAVDLANKGANKISKGAKWVGENTTIGKGVAAAKDWILGKTSQLFESGKGGSGTVSSGKGDNGGASYGTYQLSSKQGTLQEFLKSSKYGAQFEGLVPGSKEFNDKWKQTAKDDPSFGSAQHEFIKNTHFDPQMEKLKNAGIDLSNRGAAVKDSVWSTSVQFGGKSGLIEKALKDKDVSKLSDSDIVSAIQDYKIANNNKLFAKSSDDIKNGTLSRAQSEKEKLLNLASSEQKPASEDPTQQGNRA